MSDELELLKARAKTLGINFHPSIGVDALKTKINNLMDGKASSESVSVSEQDQLTEPSVYVEATTPDFPEPEPERQKDVYEPTLSFKGQTSEAPKKTLTPADLKALARVKQRKEMTRLVRIRINCLNPQKKDLRGEVITVCNSLIGTMAKFVPFGEATDNGYHVPFFIYLTLKDRKFVSLRTRKDPRTGVDIVSQQLVPEFAIEVLKPLTPAELKQLAASQAAAHSID